MPLVRIEIRKGKSPQYKQKLLDIVHACLVDALKIPEGDRMQRLYELDAEHFEHSAQKSDDCAVIELTLFKGRSLQAKRKLYALLAQKLQAELGLRPQDVMVVIREPELDNWGISGKPASETDLGFKIDV
jgi:phenylpyruvate tautomerase PptA (4-oxalocrotonate tautomerase family)